MNRELLGVILIIPFLILMIKFWWEMDEYFWIKIKLIGLFLIFLMAMVGLNLIFVVK